MPQKILRTPAAGEYIGLSPSTLEKLRCLGEGPNFIRLGARIVGYEVAELDRWIEERRSSSQPTNG